MLAVRDISGCCRVAASAVMVAAMVAAIGLAIGLAGGCGGGAASSSAAEPHHIAAGPPLLLPPTPPRFVPGEVMSFEMSLRGVVGGTAMLTVGTPGAVDGRRAIVVRSRVQSAGVVDLIKHVSDDVQSWIDLDTSALIRHHADLVFGDKLTVVDTSVHPRHVAVEYSRNRRPKVKRRQVLPAGVPGHDSHSILGAIRAWDPKLGDAVSFYVISGRRLWHSDLHFTRRETVRTPMGLYPALRLDGVATRMTSRLQIDARKKPRAYTMWISDDSNRLPLRVTAGTEYGEVKAELVDYSAGPH